MIFREKLNELNEFEKHFQNLSVSVYGTQQLFVRQQKESEEQGKAIEGLATQSNETTTAINSSNRVASEILKELEKRESLLSELRSDLNRTSEECLDLEQEYSGLRSDLMVKGRLNSKISEDFRRSDTSLDSADYEIMRLESELQIVRRDISNIVSQTDKNYVQSLNVCKSLISETGDSLKNITRAYRQVLQSRVRNEQISHKRKLLMTSTLRLLNETHASVWTTESEIRNLNDSLVKEQFVGESLVKEFVFSCKLPTFSHEEHLAKLELEIFESGDKCVFVEKEIWRLNCEKRAYLELFEKNKIQIAQNLKTKRDYQDEISRIVKERADWMTSRKLGSVELHGILKESRKIAQFVAQRELNCEQVQHEYDLCVCVVFCVCIG